ncbi:MAG: permease [Zavarzinella sp.]
MDIFWSVVLRTAQTAIESSSTIFTGILIAAIMRRMLGQAATRKLFGGSGIKGLLRAWVIGSLLPICALGVIPVARELRRSGVPPATVLSFILAAPQLNPLSFLYGLTLSEPIVILVFVAATMAIAVFGGQLWKWCFKDDEQVIDDEPLPPPGLKRLGIVLVTAARITVSSSALYMLVAILLTGAIAGGIPHGQMGRTMRHDDPFSPLLMMGLGLPIYSGVLPGMMRIGLMFEHGNSVGASFVLFESVVGCNLGLIAWLVVSYGVRRISIWLLCIVAVVLVSAYAMEKPLYFANEEASHTHAFDEWTSPFPEGTNVQGATVYDKAMEKVEVLEPLALGGIAFFALLGAGLLGSDRTDRLDQWLLKSAPLKENQQVSVWNRKVPGPVLGFVALLVLIAFSGVALFIYYPDKKQAMEEIRSARADAVTAVRVKNYQEAIRQLEQWDLLSRKMQVGVFLRTGSLREDQSAATQELRDVLEEIRDAMIAQDHATGMKFLPQLEEKHRTFRDLFMK